MMYAHNIRLRCVLRTKEDAEQLKSRLIAFFGEEITPFISSEKLSYEGLDTLYVLSLYVKKQSLVRFVLTKILSSLTKEDFSKLKNNVSSSIDSRLRFFFRISKKSFIRNTIIPGSGSDSINIIVTPAAFPKNKPSTLSIINNMLDYFEVSHKL